MVFEVARESYGSKAHRRKSVSSIAVEHIRAFEKISRHPREKLQMIPTIKRFWSETKSEFPWAAPE